MAVFITGGLLLIFTCVLGVSWDPNCAPVCKGSVCPVKLTLLDSEECECRLILRYPVDTNPKLRLSCQKGSVKIRGPKIHRLANDSTLVLHGRDREPVCYNVELASSEIGPNAKQRRQRLRIGCSEKDQSLLQSMFLLSGYTQYTVESQNGRDSMSTCSPERPTSVSDRRINTTGCNCWSPEKVIIEPLENNTLMVKWIPYYVHKDLRVRVEVVKSETKERNRDRIVPNYQLCNDKLRSYKFTNFDPGEYYAEVGAQGCDCIVYTRSDKITIPEKTLPPVENKLRNTPAADPPSGVVGTSAVIIVVGVLAVIGVTSLGTTLFIRKHCKKPYVPVETELKEIGTGEAPSITIVLDQPTKEEKDIATHLKILFDQQDIKVTSIQKLSPIQRDSELLVLISLRDSRAFQNPTIDGFHKPKTIEVLTDYTVQTEDPKSPLVVYVPEDIDHPNFKNFENDTRGRSQFINLRDAMNHINPNCDFNADEFSRFSQITKEMIKDRKDAIKNILIVSGFVHEHHNNACLELQQMLQNLKQNGKVSYAFDNAQRNDIKEFGPVQWTLTQLEKADLVVVVVSKFLYKLLDCYTKEKNIPGFNKNLAICAPLALTQLSLLQKRPKIAYVSFGYESTYEGDIVQMHCRLQSDMRYNLVEANQTAMSQGGHTHEHYALEVFLSRFSSNSRLVKEACANSEAFFESVQAMAAMMANEKQWLAKRYGPMESLASFFTVSDMSLASWNREQEIYQSKSQNIECAETVYTRRGNMIGHLHHSDSVSRDSKDECAQQHQV